MKNRPKVGNNKIPRIELKQNYNLSDSMRHSENSTKRKGTAPSAYSDKQNEVSQINNDAPETLQK